MAFTRAMFPDVSEGTKDRGYQNMERVRTLSDRPHIELRAAPDQHQQAGAPMLLHDSQGYTTPQRHGKNTFDYTPLQDTIVEPSGVRAWRGMVGN